MIYKIASDQRGVGVYLALMHLQLGIIRMDLCKYYSWLIHGVVELVSHKHWALTELGDKAPKTSSVKF